MAQHNRRPHTREVNGQAVNVSAAVVNRADVDAPPPLEEAQKDRLSAALNEIAELVNEAEAEITLDDQIMILRETRKLIAADIDRSPKVGFRSDPEAVAAKRMFLAELESQLGEMQKRSLKETEEKIMAAATQMGNFNTTGFTARLDEAAALKSYVEELFERLAVTKASLES